MAIGAAFPAPGLWAAERGVTSLATAGIFLISVLGVRAEQAAGALRARREVLFGLASILLLTPALAAPLAAAVPLEPKALSTGLGVFFCMPTTLSSGVALTAAAGGDAALALLLTVSSNFLGVLTAPWAVATLLSLGGSSSGAAAAVAVEPLPLLRSLARTVAAPLALGSALRSLPFKNHLVARTVDSNKKELSYLSTALLATVPWSQVSRAVAGGAALPAGPLALSAAAGVGIHCGLLLFNLAAVRLLNLGGGRRGRGGRSRSRSRSGSRIEGSGHDGGDGGVGGKSPEDEEKEQDDDEKEEEQAFGARVALVICCSQKALTVAVPVVAALFASSASSSLGSSASSSSGLTSSSSALAATATIPIVVLHMMQTALDGLIAARVAKNRESERERKRE